MSSAADFKEVERLWREYCAIPFPEGLAGQEVSGVEVAMVDTVASGCIDTFIARQGSLDTWRTAILGLCYRNLGVATVGLQGEARAYVARLEILARLVLESVRDGAKPA